MFDLSGRVALVTGAGQGVGVGIARALAARGAAVAINDLVPERAEATAERLAAEGARCREAPFDVTDAAAAAAGIAAAESELGAVDILVHNAGVPPGMTLARFLDLPPTQGASFVDLNLYGLLHCTRAVLPGMCDREFGRLIAISSGAAQAGLGIGVSLYGAAKAGALGFMRHLAIEVARRGVTANSLALGLMASAAMGPETEAIARTIPVGRLGDGADVGAACVWLASDEASWVTGQTIGINGGSATS